MALNYFTPHPSPSRGEGEPARRTSSLAGGGGGDVILFISFVLVIGNNYGENTLNKSN